MSDKVFIDTNILLYAYDIDAGIKHNVAREVIRRYWEERSGVTVFKSFQSFSPAQHERVAPS